MKPDILRIETPPEMHGCRPGHEVGLLADAIELKPGQCVAELGSGVGALALQLAARVAVEVVGFEIQGVLAKAARRNARLNARRLQGRVRFEPMDIRRLAGSPWANRFDHVVANPPFYRAGQGRRPPQRQRAAARHEIDAMLEDFVRAAAILLRARGRFHCILRPERLEDLLALTGRYHCPVKWLQPVYTRRQSNAKWVITTGVKGGRAGLTMAPPRDLTGGR